MSERPGSEGGERAGGNRVERVPSELDDGTCVECSRTFRGKRGLSQHRRRAHPEEYFSGLEALKINALGGRRRWTEEEMKLLAREEVRLLRSGPITPGELLIRLHDRFPDRTVEAIKGRRKHDAYKAVLGAMSEEVGDLRRQNEVTSGDEQERRLKNEYRMAIQEQAAPLVDHQGQVLGLPDISLRFQKFLFGERGPKRHTPRKKPVLVTVAPTKRLSRSVRKHRERGKVLAMYDKAPERTGKNIVKGTGMGGTSATQSPGEEEMYGFWKDIFSKPSKRDERPVEAINPPQWEIASPIGVDEVKSAQKSLKKGAPGKDGLKAVQVKALCAQTLAGYFNSFLYHEDIPSDLKQGSTTLIPKVDTPVGPQEFRPITLSSVVLRLFHSIVASRLGRIEIGHRQKGFQQTDGCGENVWLVKSLVDRSIRRLQPLNIAFCDVRKAFDSVSHQSMIRACHVVGVPGPWTRYLRNAHNGITTVLKCDPLAREIDCTVGVRQGDPVSCHLFNFVMMQTVADVPKEVGIPLEEAGTVSYGMLADDTFLMSETKEGLRMLFEQFEEALRLQGMALNPAKCRTLQIDCWKAKKKWYVPRKAILKSSNGSMVATMSIGETYKYLGVEIGADGVSGEGGSQQLHEQLARLKGCALRPQQKLHILRAVVIPGLYYTQTLAEFCPSRWKDFDRQVRSFVRKVLHLPKDTPLGYYHASHRSGGLAIPSLYTQIGRLRRDRLLKLFDSPDPILKYLCEKDVFLQGERRKHEGEVKVNGVVFPGTKKENDVAWTEVLLASVDGRGLEHHSQSGSYKSFWVIDRASKLSGREYVSAVHVRGSLLKTPSRGARGRQKDSNLCDTCCDQVCNMGHMLQVCPLVLDQRVHRHNEVVKAVSRVGEKRKYEVIHEPRITVGKTFLKPDLIMIGKEKCLVIDPMVLSDNGDLDLANANKATKYQIPEVMDFISTRHKVQFPSAPAPTIDLSGAVLDWRGCWATTSHTFLQKTLGMSKTELEYVSIRCLLAGRKMWYVATLRRKEKHGRGKRCRKPP